MIGTIGRRLDIEHHIAQHIRQRSPQRGVGVEFQNALVFVRQPKLPLRADHPQRGHAANLALAQLAQFPSVGVDQLRPNLRKRDRLPLSQIRRPADHLQRLFSPVIDRRQTQSVGIRMLFHRRNPPDHYLLPIAAAALDRLDLRPGHAQSVRQFLDR